MSRSGRSEQAFRSLSSGVPSHHRGEETEGFDGDSAATSTYRWERQSLSNSAVSRFQHEPEQRRATTSSTEPPTTTAASQKNSTTKSKTISDDIAVSSLSSAETPRSSTVKSSSASNSKRLRSDSNNDKGCPPANANATFGPILLAIDGDSGNEEAVDAGAGGMTVCAQFLTTYYPVALRPYQLRAVEGLTRHFRSKWDAIARGETTEAEANADAMRNPSDEMNPFLSRGGVVHLRTGAGKTEIAIAAAFIEIFYPVFAAPRVRCVGGQGGRGGANRGNASYTPRDIVMLTPTRVLTAQQAKCFYERMRALTALALAEAAGFEVDVLVSTMGSVSPVTVDNSNGNIITAAANAAASKFDRRTKALRRTVRILVSTPGSYIELIQKTSDHHNRGDAVEYRYDTAFAFPMPSQCSTIFFDEVHHCASNHPFSQVAKAIHQVTLQQQDTCVAHTSNGLPPPPPPRTVGLTATLCYATADADIAKDIRALFGMLRAPLSERYSATREELSRSGVPEPPTCKVLDLYEEEEMSFTQLLEGGNRESGGTTAESLRFQYPHLVIGRADVNTMLSLINQSFFCLDENPFAFDDVMLEADAVRATKAFKRSDRSGQSLRPQRPSEAYEMYSLIDQGVHVYTKHIYLFTQSLEVELDIQKWDPLRKERCGLIKTVPLKDLTRTCCNVLKLDPRLFLTISDSHRENLSISAAPFRGNRRHPSSASVPVRQLKGELLCVMYQALRLIIASKQRDLEIAVRYLHRARPLFEAIYSSEEASGGAHSTSLAASTAVLFLDRRIPLWNSFIQKAAFNDCGRVINALRSFADTAVVKPERDALLSQNRPFSPNVTAHGQHRTNGDDNDDDAISTAEDFRTIIFCESALSVAVLSEYITTCFVEEDRARCSFLERVKRLKGTRAKQQVLSLLGNKVKREDEVKLEAKDDGDGSDKSDDNASDSAQSGSPLSSYDDLMMSDISPSHWIGTTDYLYRSDWLASTSNAPAFNIPHRSQNDQDCLIEDFKRGYFNVLCATTVVEEGLDVSTVRCIIHLAPPTNPVAQTQRSGRARAANNTQSVVLDTSDGNRVNQLDKVAEAQANVAAKLASTSGKDLIPKLMSDQCSAPLATAVVAAHILSTSSAVKSEEPVSSSYSSASSPFSNRATFPPLPRHEIGRFSKMNPISALHELRQAGHIGLFQEEAASRPFHGSGGFLFTVTMSLDASEAPKGVAISVTTEPSASKKDAKTKAATMLLNRLFEDA